MMAENEEEKPCLEIMRSINSFFSTAPAVIVMFLDRRISLSSETFLFFNEASFIRKSQRGGEEKRGKRRENDSDEKTCFSLLFVTSQPFLFFFPFLISPLFSLRK